MFGDELDYDEFDARVFDYTKPKGSSSATLSGRSSAAAPYHTHHMSMDHTSVNSSPEVSKSYTGLTKKHSLQEDASHMHLLRSVSEDPGRPSSFDGKYTKFRLLTKMCKADRQEDRQSVDRFRFKI